MKIEKEIARGRRGTAGKVSGDGNGDPTAERSGCRLRSEAAYSVLRNRVRRGKEPGSGRALVGGLAADR